MGLRTGEHRQEHPPWWFDLGLQRLVASKVLTFTAMAQKSKHVKNLKREIIEDLRVHHWLTSFDNPSMTREEKKYKIMNYIELYSTNHWASNHPKTCLILKNNNQPTWCPPYRQRMATYVAFSKGGILPESSLRHCAAWSASSTYRTAFRRSRALRLTLLYNACGIIRVVFQAGWFVMLMNIPSMS